MPEWKVNQIMLNTWEYGLNSGNLDSEGYMIYRMDLETGQYMPICTLPVNETHIVDFSVVNNHRYQYYLYYEAGGKYTDIPMVSEPASICNWAYTLLLAEKDEEGAYRVRRQYPMTCNVETGSVGNNNAPSVQKNFTRYPVWSPDNSCYRSGNLNAYIGKCDSLTNEYSEKWACRTR